MGGWIDGWMDGRMGRRLDGWINGGKMDGWMGASPYPVCRGAAVKGSRRPARPDPCHRRCGWQ